MSKQFWGVIIVIVLVLVGIFAFTGKSTKTTDSAAAKPTSHVEGKGLKKVTLVEYGDFQCQFCGQYYPTIRQVIQTYGDDISFQFRHFPITSLHQNAFAASRAAEAAGKQGKFFEMYDLLYQSQQAWSRTSAPQTTFEDYAAQLKLDEVKFKTDYASSAINDAINADQAAGNKLGVTGTPSFFINGKQVTIANSVDSFKKAIDAEIVKKNPAGSGSSLNDSMAPVNERAPGTPAPTDNSAN